jgi:hypothetical protein
MDYLYLVIAPGACAIVVALTLIFPNMFALLALKTHG